MCADWDLTGYSLWGVGNGGLFLPVFALRQTNRRVDDLVSLSAMTAVPNAVTRLPSLCCCCDSCGDLCEVIL